jgi:hypothetical protein
VEGASIPGRIKIEAPTMYPTNMKQAWGSPIDLLRTLFSMLSYLSTGKMKNWISDIPSLWDLFFDGSAGKSDSTFLTSYPQYD